MKKFGSIAFIVLLSLAVFNCADGKSGMKKVINHEGLQLSFDVIDEATHPTMMQSMTSEKNKDGLSGRYVSLTIVSLAKQEQVKDAKVSFSIIDPAGKTSTQPGTVMSGMGRVHYLADFKKDATGLYKVKANVVIGSVTQDHEVEFKL